MAILGFIGVGNMGGALAASASRTLAGTDILLANRTTAKAEALAAKLGCTVSTSEEIAHKADFIFLGVKPQMMAGLLTTLSPHLAQRQGRFVLVTMAAGLTTADIRRMAGGDYPVLRIMPNTPSAIGAGMVLYAPGEGVTEADVSEFLRLMAAAGRFTRLDEHLIDAGSAVSGCGPAFVDLFIEALADGGVLCGLPRVAAMEMAAQMVLGSALLVLESGEHPGALKDKVCSPGGSTIQGVRALEAGGFRSAVIDAVVAACERSKSLGKA